MTRSPYALAVVPDLFFAAKIAAVARSSGAEVAFAPVAEAAARCAAEPPALLLVDLHAGPEVHALVHALKSDDATRAVPVVGFFSHVDLATRDAALAAGIDRAMPRSAFVTRLPELLAGVAAAPGTA